MKISMLHWWNDTGRRRQEYWEKTCVSLSTTKSNVDRTRASAGLKTKTNLRYTYYSVGIVQ